MESTLPAALVILALIDSTSIGTLFIPIWLLLAPDRPPVRRLLGYLATIAGFYLLVGVVLTLIASAGWAAVGDVADDPVLLWLQLAVGVALFVLCWRFDSGQQRKQGEPDRATRWRDQALRGAGSARGLTRLAFTAGALELATMLPYLGAIGLLATGGLSPIQYVPLLVLYCVVMVLPAVALIATRLTTHTRPDGTLRRLDVTLSRHADSAIGWVMGIAGFLIASDAAARLWSPELFAG